MKETNEKLWTIIWKSKDGVAGVYYPEGITKQKAEHIVRLLIRMGKNYEVPDNISYEIVPKQEE